LNIVYVYLGSTFAVDNSCIAEIRNCLAKCLAMTRSAMQSLTAIWKSISISLPTKMRLVKALVWYIAFYGREGWIIVHKKEENYIEAFEM